MPTHCAPVLTTRPQPASIMAGSAALVAWKGAFRMTSMICKGSGNQSVCKTSGRTSQHDNVL